MESLALAVVLLLLWLLLAGPIGIYLSRTVLAPLGIVFGVLSVLCGMAYLVAQPVRVKPLAIWALLAGVVAIHLGVMRFTGGKVSDA